MCTARDRGRALVPKRVSNRNHRLGGQSRRRSASRCHLRSLGGTDRSEQLDATQKSPLDESIAAIEPELEELRTTAAVDDAHLRLRPQAQRRRRERKARLHARHVHRGASNPRSRTGRLSTASSQASGSGAGDETWHALDAAAQGVGQMSQFHLVQAAALKAGLAMARGLATQALHYF